MSNNKTTFLIFLILLIIGGIWFYSSQEKQAGQPIVEQKTKQEEIIKEEGIDTSDWLTYRNDEYGFEFKYPEDWEVIILPDKKAGIALRSSQYNLIRSGSVDLSGEIYVKQISNPQNLTVEELFKTFSDSSRFWFDKHEYENININGLSGVKFYKFMEHNTSFYRTEIYLSCNKKFVSFSYFYEEDKYQDILNNIISSLKCSFR